MRFRPLRARSLTTLLLGACVLITPMTASGQYCSLLAIGVPDYDAASVSDSGAVSVLHALEGQGISTTASRYFTQNSTDFGTSPAADDSFGESVVVADFNGDGFPDMAIGVPWEDIGGDEGAGLVHVVYGTVFGMLAYTAEMWHHNVTAVPGDTSYHGQFGAAVAAGDFDGDGFDDLAVGTPEYFLSGVSERTGAVNVFYGTVDGLTAVGGQLWTQGSTGILGEPEDLDHFGAALAAGDFDGDGYDDLAIGVPWEDLPEVDFPVDQDAGAVNVLYGTSTGLGSSRNQMWTQGSPLQDDPEDNDFFGAALAAGDFNDDGEDDLAIGAPGEEYAARLDTGVVHMICGWGAGVGLAEWNDQMWSQNSPGIQDQCDDWDEFGAALQAGDFNADGYDDLAVGAPGETLFDNMAEEVEGAGVIHVIHGGSSWLEWEGNLKFNQATNGIDGDPGVNEHFGHALAAADLDCDGYADLVVGVPWENPDGVVDAGAVHAFYGSPSSLYSDRYEMWHLGVPGVEGNLEEDAGFGQAIAAGSRDLVLFLDSFERGSTERWSSEVP